MNGVRIGEGDILIKENEIYSNSPQLLSLVCGGVFSDRNDILL